VQHVYIGGKMECQQPPAHSTYPRRCGDRHPLPAKAASKCAPSNTI
jgi:hypothetical protein